MSRPSAAAKLTVIAGDFNRRPEPPDDLTDAEAVIWRETCASEAAGFFDTAALRGLLKDYSRHRAAADALFAVAAKIPAAAAMNAEHGGNYDRLRRMIDRETHAADRKARSLRLTNQSRYTPKAAATAAKHASTARKPWEAA